MSGRAFSTFGDYVLTARGFSSSLPYIIVGVHQDMTETQTQDSKPRRLQTRALLILLAVGTAVAIPILPLRFLGIPGPDFPDVSQVVTSSKNWLSKVASRIESLEDTPHAGMPPPQSSTPAEQVKMLETAADQLHIEIEKSPCDPGLQNQLGLVYVSLGDIDKARAGFQKAISLSRLDINGLADKITALRSQGKTKEASLELLQAAKMNVELSAAHSNLARLYENRGEHDKVIAELDMLNKEGVLFDNSVLPAGSDGSRQAMLNPTVARDLARAEALMQARQLPQAETEYKRVLAEDPRVGMAHHRLGTIMLLTNNAPAAVKELELAAKLDPGSPEVLSDLGWAYQQTGMNVQAAKAYERALALEPRQTDAAINLSNLYSSCGRVHDAIVVLSQAVQTNQDSAKAHNNLGTLFSLDGRWGPAFYEFQKAVTLEPNMASAHYGLGTVLMQNKNYTQAVQEFKQALTLQPNLAQAQMKIDEAYRKIGMTVGSAQALN
jgi:Flp pilus assembly protein TadD